MKFLYTAVEVYIRFVLPIGGGACAAAFSVTYVVLGRPQLAVGWGLAVVIAVLNLWLANRPKARKQWREQNGEVSDDDPPSSDESFATLDIHCHSALHRATGAPLLHSRPRHPFFWAVAQ
jgi:hypothetical protein